MKRYFYKRFVDPVDPDKEYDELKVINERAAQGWRLHNLQHAQQTTNISAMNGQPIVRVVVIMIMFRELEDGEEAPVESDGT